MIWEILEVASDCFTCLQVFGFKCLPIGSQNIADFVTFILSGFAGAQRIQRWPNGPYINRLQVDMINLKDATNIRLIGCARAQLFDRRLFVPKGFKEQVRKLGGLERTFGQSANGFFDFNSVHYVSGSNSWVAFSFLNRRNFLRGSLALKWCNRNLPFPLAGLGNVIAVLHPHQRIHGYPERLFDP